MILTSLFPSDKLPSNCNDLLGLTATLRCEAAPAADSLPGGQIFVSLSTLLEYLRTGDIVVWLLLLGAMVALGVMLDRFRVFLRARIHLNQFLAVIRKALILNHSIRDAIKICEQYRSPIASIMKAGLLRFGEPREEIELTIENAAKYELDKLERGLVLLTIVASGAPLLGFLGTLLQFAQIFNGLGAAGVTVEAALRSQVSHAFEPLIFGLLVALPVQTANLLFHRRINRTVHKMEIVSYMLVETFGEMERVGITASRATQR